MITIHQEEIFPRNIAQDIRNPKFRYQLSMGTWVLSATEPNWTMSLGCTEQKNKILPD